MKPIRVFIRGKTNKHRTGSILSLPSEIAPPKTGDLTAVNLQARFYNGGFSDLSCNSNETTIDRKYLLEMAEQVRVSMKKELRLDEWQKTVLLKGREYFYLFVQLLSGALDDDGK